MNVLRTILTAFLVAALVGLPVLLAPGVTEFPGPTARAATFERPMLDNHNENGNGNANENHNGNGNHNGNNNGNQNNNDNDDDNGNGNGNENEHDWTPPPPPTPPAPPPPPPAAAHCYGAGEAGAVTLELPGGSVALTVVPASTFPGATGVSLERVDPSSAPGTPGARLDEIVFELRAQAGCDGGWLSELPSDVNLGLRYTVPATSATLTFAVWDGSRWVEVPTVADPNPGNPYISATVRQTGLYAVYTRP